MTCAAVASPDEDSNIASDGAFTLATTSPSRLKASVLAVSVSSRWDPINSPSSVNTSTRRKLLTATRDSWDTATLLGSFANSPGPSPSPPHVATSRPPSSKTITAKASRSVTTRWPFGANAIEVTRTNWRSERSSPTWNSSANSAASRRGASSSPAGSSAQPAPASASNTPAIAIFLARTISSGLPSSASPVSMHSSR